MKTIVTINDLLVRRSPQFCLSIPTLRLQTGHILGVVGSNGSGKTTLIESVGGIIGPDQGLITVQGHPLSLGMHSTKAAIGYIPDDENWLIAELCAEEYFELLMKIYSKAGVSITMPERIKSLSSDLQFTAFRQPLQTLSHGNKKKVQIIAGLMHAPSLIVVDELRNGLDPLAILAAEQLIKKEARRGAGIIAATHDLWWTQRFADEILLIGNGKLVTHANTAALVARHGSLENFFLATLGDKN